MNNLRPVKGCRDLLDQDILSFRYIVDVFTRLAKLYGCSEIYTPILEHTEIFTKSLGQSSDVVTKEMYSFIDQGQDNLTLRPEFTAAIMRAVLSGGLEHRLPLRLFSYGPLFRRERPQAGRQRQFHQVNVEFLGADKPAADAELIKLGADLLQALNIADYTLQINSLGCSQSRVNYRQVLHEYFSDHIATLSEISKIRLQKNPLRILDSKEDSDQAIIADAPKIFNYYTQEAKHYFQEVQQNLNHLGIAFSVNCNIVRGLDYYNHTAFEFISSNLGGQSAIIAGGRYDGLAQMMGGKSMIPAVGFAGGIERLMILSTQEISTHKPVVVIPVTQNQHVFALRGLALLRENGIAALLESGKKIGDVIQKAINKHQAQYVVILGEQEELNQTYMVKDLANSQQDSVSFPAMLKIFKGEK